MLGSRRGRPPAASDDRGALFPGTAIIQPGRFNPIGTWIGVYFLYTGILGLEDLGLQQRVSDVFYGGALVVAVTISTLLRRRST